FRRDVSDRALLAFLESRRAAFEASAGETPSEQMENRLFELRNVIKLYRGRLDALEDPYILARRRDAQADVRAALDDDPALQEQYVGALSEMEQIQEEKRALADQYRAFLLMENSRYSSATPRRRRTCWRGARRRLLRGRSSRRRRCDRARRRARRWRRGRCRRRTPRWRR
ncbi:MAG: hypothetical protein BRD40_03635, partial [Bacteroidetes bacterium QS_1_65_9]